MAVGAFQHIALPSLEGFEPDLMTAGAGALESQELAVADASHEDATIAHFIAQLVEENDFGSPNVLQGRVFGQQCVECTAHAKGRVAGVVFGAGSEK